MSRARKDWLEWFRVDVDIERHPKTAALQAALGEGVTIDGAIGAVVRLWSWLGRYAPSGDIDAAGELALRHAQIPTDALTSAGFLARDTRGLYAPNWLGFNGYAARERDRKRNVRGMSAECPRNVRAISEPTERNGTGTEEEPTSAASREPTSPPEDLILEIPTVDGKAFFLTERQVEEWRPAYPAVDVSAQCRMAVAWLDSHPKNRKTLRGMPAYFTGWLARGQNSARTNGTVPDTEPMRPARRIVS